MEGAKTVNSSIEKLRATVLHFSHVVIEQDNELRLNVVQLLRLAKRMAGFVKSFGLNDCGPNSEYDQWKACRDAINSFSPASDTPTDIPPAT